MASAGSSSAPAPTDVPEASEGPVSTHSSGDGTGGAGPTSPGGDGGPGWIVLGIVLVLLLAALLFWARKRDIGQRRRVGEVAR